MWKVLFSEICSSQIRATVLPVEFPLIQEELMGMDMELAQAETTLRWNSEGTPLTPLGRCCFETQLRLRKSIANIRDFISSDYHLIGRMSWWLGRQNHKHHRSQV